jgi:hypothetical protein
LLFFVWLTVAESAPKWQNDDSVLSNLSLDGGKRKTICFALQTWVRREE